MTVLIFILVLGILVFVHELGHFLVAKKAGIRVDEFGLGFPPRLFGKKVGETVYSLNLIPFGGFVKIFGENGDELPSEEGDSEVNRQTSDISRSFARKKRGIQAAVLVAGVTFNFLFAWLLFSIGFMAGFPVPAADYANRELKNVELIATSVARNSPADLGGLKSGDILLSFEVGSDRLASQITPEQIQNFVARHKTEPITIDVRSGNETRTLNITPKINEASGRAMIGIAMDFVGTLRLSPFEAIVEAGKTTVAVIIATVRAFGGLIAGLWNGQASLADISGPIGIAGMIGNATRLGLMYLLSFTAFISIQLGVLNLMPFPALDGGRILFIAVEGVRRKALNPKITNTVNNIGFAILIALMIIVTYRDIAKL